MNLWIENTAEKVLYNVNGTSSFRQNDKFLTFVGEGCSEEKLYPDTASASIKYTAFRSMIITSGGLILEL